MRITYQDLPEHGACDMLERFAARWPDGVEVTEETVREAIQMGLDVWLTKYLMIPAADRAYAEAVAPARSAYHDAVAPAISAYNEAVVKARSAYHDAVAQADRAYDEEVSKADRAHAEAVAPARSAYDEARIRAFIEAARIHDEEVRDA